MMRLGHEYQKGRYLYGYGNGSIEYWEDDFNREFQEFKTLLEKSVLPAFINEAHFFNVIGMEFEKGDFSIDTGCLEIDEDIYNVADTLAYLTEEMLVESDWLLKGYLATMESMLENTMSVDQKGFELLVSQHAKILSLEHKIQTQTSREKELRDGYQYEISIHKNNRQYERKQMIQLLSLLYNEAKEPVFIGPFAFYQNDIVAITTYEKEHHLPEGFYRQYLRTATRSGKNIYEVSLTLAMSYSFQPKPRIEKDLWEHIWYPYRGPFKPTYLFRFERYQPENDWFKLTAMSQYKASVKVSAPKTVQVGRWLVPENDPMLGAIKAMESSMSELTNEIVSKDEVNLEKNHE